MPNRSWKGCNVNDPSARVLTNYGDSRKITKGGYRQCKKLKQI